MNRTSPPKSAQGKPKSTSAIQESITKDNAQLAKKISLDAQKQQDQMLKNLEVEDQIAPLSDRDCSRVMKTLNSTDVDAPSMKPFAIVIAILLLLSILFVETIWSFTEPLWGPVVDFLTYYKGRI